MKTVGIIGYGSFGKFLTEKLGQDFTVRVFSRRHQPGHGIFTTLEKVAQSDYLILSIPLHAYKDYLTRLKPLLHKKTAIIDVCSVKLKPLQIIKDILPTQPVVATHPLFGPETASESLKGHTLVICPELSDKEHAKALAEFGKSVGLKVLLESAETHDRQMATVHALTFFIARALDQFGLESYELNTPSYRRLLHLAELDKHHSDDLFDTIQSGNPYSKAVRQKFIVILNDLNVGIDKHDH